MIVSNNNLVKFNQYQMDQVMGREEVVKRELNYSDLMDLISDVKNATQKSIGNRNQSIIVKITSGDSKLYDWHDNKFSGL